VDRLGPNARGETLEPGRVADCYLGLLLPPGPAGEPEAGTILILAPAALLHPRVPQPEGSLLYELLTGHPEREASELVFVADLAGELRAWPQDTWAKLGVDPDQVAHAVVSCWQAGEVTGLQVDDLSFEEARSLTRPGDDLCPRPAPRPPDHATGSPPSALVASHHRPPTQRAVPVAAASAGRTPDAAVRPWCPEP
jgi:hypothetical protein